MLSAADSRAVRFTEVRAPGMLLAHDRLGACLDTIGYRASRLDRLFWGVAHLEGDLNPLAGDEQGIFVVSAEKP